MVFFVGLCGHKRNDNVVADFCDSKHASSHSLWGSNPHTLKFFIYFDELELCNPLGANRKTHKLGMYFCLVDFYMHLYIYKCTL